MASNPVYKFTRPADMAKRALAIADAFVKEANRRQEESGEEP